MPDGAHGIFRPHDRKGYSNKPDLPLGEILFTDSGDAKEYHGQSTPRTSNWEAGYAVSLPLNWFVFETNDQPVPREITFEDLVAQAENEEFDVEDEDEDW